MVIRENNLHHIQYYVNYSLLKRCIITIVDSTVIIQDYTDNIPD